jgi:phosphatidyl-myo-inositol dimannoside synthase
VREPPLLNGDRRPDGAGLRTLLVTNDFPPKVGGIQSYLFGLVSTLDPSEVSVLAPSHPGAEGFDAGQPFEVQREPTWKLYPGPRLARRIRELCAGTDVLQFGFALQSWLLAPEVLRKTGVPYVVFAHGAEILLPLRLPGAARLLTWGSLRQAAAVVAVSEHTAAGVERYTGGRIACEVLRPVADLEGFRRTEQARKRVRDHHGLGARPTILCVSRLTPRKGQDRLIDALPGLNRRFGARLLLVGEGGIEKSLRRRARRRNVEDEIVFAGKVPETRLSAYYAAADVFAMPARNRLLGAEEEGFGVVFVEAASSGLPMVVGDSGGAAEAVKDGVSGYLVNGASTEEIRGALGRLLGDGQLRRRMGEAARERAVALHDASVLGRRYREVLCEAAQKAPAGWGTIATR